MEGTMGPSRTELMQFIVTPYEKKVIEDFVRKRHDTVSEYVRSAVIMDMVLEGEVKAMKIVVDTIGRNRFCCSINARIDWPNWEQKRQIHNKEWR